MGCIFIIVGLFGCVSHIFSFIEHFSLGAETLCS